MASNRVEHANLVAGNDLARSADRGANPARRQGLVSFLAPIVYSSLINAAQPSAGQLQDLNAGKNQTGGASKILQMIKASNLRVHRIHLIQEWLKQRWAANHMHITQS